MKKEQKSKFLKTPRTDEEQKALYAKVYDDDYLDEKFDKSIDAMLDAKLNKDN